MANNTDIILRETTVRLMTEKALFLPEWKALLIADLHLGKVNHFRKSGLPVPAAANHHNTATLIELIRGTDASRLIFLGDLFHSHYNPEWEVLGQVRSHFSHCSFELVPGNHDIMSNHQYARHNILVHPPVLPLGPFMLTHDPETKVSAGYVLAGHVHPGIRLAGKGRQSVVLPCFYFGSNLGLLPAFGAFTGMKPITPAAEDRVYALATDNIIEV